MTDLFVRAGMILSVPAGDGLGPKLLAGKILGRPAYLEPKVGGSGFAHLLINPYNEYGV